MDCSSLTLSSLALPVSKHILLNKSVYVGYTTMPRNSFTNIQASSSSSSDNNGAPFPSASHLSSSSEVGDMHRKLSTLESLFCYDKAIPEEIIEEPVGLSLSEKNIGNKTRCTGCEAKGAILCATCSGSGLYVDSIMESQGIIVKVRCLGCGGSGNIMCSECGGRGYRSAT